MTATDASRVLPTRRYVVAATSARMVAEGTAITLVLLGTDRDLDSAALGVLVACWTLPQVLTAPFVGTVADRALHPARLLGGLIALAAIGFAALGAGLGSVPIAVLGAVAALISLAEPALMGALSGIATRTAGPRFESWDALSYGSAGICAQALVGVVAAVSGPALALAVLVALGGVAAILVATLPLRGASPAEEHHAHAPAETGARKAISLIWRDPELKSMTILTTLSMSAFGGLALVAVDLAEHHGRPAADGSHLVLAMAVGAVLGSLAWTRLPSPERPTRTAAASVAVIGIAFATSAVGSWPWCIAAFAVVGVADAPMLVATFASRNRRSPASVRASVYTVSASLKIAATSAGAVAAGLLLGWQSGVSGPLTLAAFQLVSLVAFAASGGGRLGAEPREVSLRR